MTTWILEKFLDTRYWDDTSNLNLFGRSNCISWIDAMLSIKFARKINSRKNFIDVYCFLDKFFSYYNYEILKYMASGGN